MICKKSNICSYPNPAVISKKLEQHGRISEEALYMNSLNDTELKFIFVFNKIKNFKNT